MKETIKTPCSCEKSLKLARIILQEVKLKTLLQELRLRQKTPKTQQKKKNYPAYKLRIIKRKSNHKLKVPLSHQFQQNFKTTAT